MSRILIVDDDPQGLYMLEALLKGHGHEVVTAVDGSDALKKARRNPPDIIISDFFMPTMDGFALCRECKKDDLLKDTPFIAYTATYTDPKDEELALSLGAARFLVKPIEPDVFLREVEQILAEAKAGRLPSPPEPAYLEQRLREYNEALIRKLEAKVKQFLETNRALQEEIVQRRHAEESLRESEARYRGLVELSPDAIFVNRNNRIELVNPAALQLFGVTTADQVIGKSPLDFFHPDSQELIRERMRTVLTGQSVHLVEAKVVRVNGEVRIAEVAASPFVDLYGMAIQVFLRDITDRKRAEQRLFEANQRLQALMDALPVGVSFSNDPTCQNITDNPAAHVQFESTNGGDLSSSVPDDRAQARLVRFFREGRAVTYDELPLQRAVAENEAIPPVEHEVVMPSGRRWYAEISGAPIRDADGNVIGGVAVTLDISERKRAEQSLRQVNASLEEHVNERTAKVQQLADQLRRLAAELSLIEQRERKRLAVILHDHIQQLLVAAQMQLGLIKRIDRDTIESAVQGVESIIKEAIDTSRSLTIELSPPILHQAGLAAALGWLADRMNEKHMFKVHVRVNEDDEQASEAVRFMLFESVRELLLNAVKHSGASEAYVTLERAPEGWTKITVEDKGNGFDPDTLKFRKSGGFGIFSIQQRLAYLGGRIEIESAPGHGTRIVLCAPLEEMQTMTRTGVVAVGTAPELAVRSLKKGKDISVLLVDDHKIVRQGLVSLLRFESHMQVVGEAANGQEAVELARKFDPDVVVMDINMPVMDGVEATRIITRELPHVKVIGLSMYMEHDVAEAMQKAGAAGYLTKGGRSEDLINAIRACVANRDLDAVDRHE